MNAVNPIRDPESALDRLFHKMTWVPEILRRQADYDREVELFGAAWQEVQDLRNQVAAVQELLEAADHALRWLEHCRVHGMTIGQQSEQILRAAVAKALQAKHADQSLPALGDEDATVAIADDGAEFLAAISGLETTDREFTYLYLGWRMYKVDETIYFASRNFGEFTLKAPTALALVTAIYTLETNGVTEPVEEDAS